MQLDVVRIFLGACCCCALLADCVDAKPVISEYMAVPGHGFVDDFGEEEDWIELYNPSTSPLDLAGLSVGDSSAAASAMRIPLGFPEVTVIPAGGYLVLWFDKDEEQGRESLPLRPLPQRCRSRACLSSDCLSD